jgi:hypothetical protein
MVDTVLKEPTRSARPTAWPRPIAWLLRLTRRSIPKSLVLAVIGIGLSSWLIPAITRQWDDRQKAGDLKAALVAEMATATGRAVLDAQTFTYARATTHPSQSANDSIKEWSVAALEVRAKLDAYFGPPAVDAWNGVTQYVDATLSVAYRGRNHEPALIPLRDASDGRPPAGRVQNLYGEFLAGNDTVIDQLAPTLLAQEQSVARSVLAMNVRGYSTSLHNLLSDLLPNV